MMMVSATILLGFITFLEGFNSASASKCITFTLGMQYSSQNVFLQTTMSVKLVSSPGLFAQELTAG